MYGNLQADSTEENVTSSLGSGVDGNFTGVFNKSDGKCKV